MDAEDPVAPKHVRFRLADPSHPACGRADPAPCSARQNRETAREVSDTSITALSRNRAIAAADPGAAEPPRLRASPPPVDPQVTFAQILQARALERPDRRAFVFLNANGSIAEELTFADLHRRAGAIAAEILARGLGGKRVLLIFPPGLDFVAALFGCFYAGAVAVPTPYSVAKRAEDRIAAIRKDADPAGALTVSRLAGDTEMRGAVRADELAWLRVDNIETNTGTDAEAWPFPAGAPEDLALLQYTSGSTTAPKGVMLTHANLIANSAMIQEAFGHDDSGRGVSWLPTFHDMGLVGHVLQPVAAGALSVLMSPLSFVQSPARWLRAISAWRATTSGGPSHAYDLCLRLIRPEQIQGVDLSSWQVAYCGAEKVRADVLERFAGRFAGHGFRQRSLYACYGLAEATLMVSGGHPGTGLRLASLNPEQAQGGGATGRLPSAVSCGWPWRGSAIAIADPHSGTRLRDGQVGEIWVRGPHVARGYWRQGGPATEPFEAMLQDGDGPYLKTGDLGFVTEGELFVVGRIKDTIVIRGLQHASEDIEATVARSHPGFSGSAAAAFGIERDGEEHVIVVQEVARAALKAGSQAEAVEAAMASVTGNHGLRLLDLMLVRAGSLPRTSSGKVQRARCRALYEAGEFERLDGAGAQAT